jgi:hypothetical protein
MRPRGGGPERLWAYVIRKAKHISMVWENGHIAVNHTRTSWDNTVVPDLIVHTRWDQLNGNYQNYDEPEKIRVRDLYKRAKFSYDHDAAFDLIDLLVNNEKTDQLAEIVAQTSPRPILIFPYPAFGDDDAVDAGRYPESGPTNALPHAYGAYLEAVLGCGLNTEVTQKARIGRTKLKMFERFLYQPSFIGGINDGANYLLIDDVTTTAGTLACLRSYIVENGGTVIGASCIAHKSGIDQRFVVAQDTLNVLLSIYGNELGTFWLEGFGHELECLTESEAQFLARWGLEREADQGWSRGAEFLQRLRDRFDQAASTGR